jgi:hypothetical protein
MNTMSMWLAATVIVLFFAKLIWNITIPFWLRKSNSGVSLLPILEFMLLFVSLLLCYISDLRFGLSLIQLLGIGIFLILLSYLLMWIFGTFHSNFASKNKFK